MHSLDPEKLTSSDSPSISKAEHFEPTKKTKKNTKMQARGVSNLLKMRPSPSTSKQTENLQMRELSQAGSSSQVESIDEKLQQLDSEAEETIEKDLKAKRAAILSKLSAVETLSKVHRKQTSQDDKLKYEQELLKVLKGRDQMNWARKIFLQTAELIFPGVSESSKSNANVPKEDGGFAFAVKIRASIPLNVLLHGHYWFFWFWIFAFFYTSDIRMLVLKNLHWILNICVAVAFSLINFARIYIGEGGNGNDDIQSLAIFWMISVIIQIPFILFLLLTDAYSPVFLPFPLVMHGVLCYFLLFESIVGFFHLRTLLMDEQKVILFSQKAEKHRDILAENLEGKSKHKMQIPQTFEPKRNAQEGSTEEEELEDLEGPKPRSKTQPTLKGESLKLVKIRKSLKESSKDDEEDKENVRSSEDESEDEEEPSGVTQIKPTTFRRKAFA